MNSFHITLEKNKRYSMTSPWREMGPPYFVRFIAQNTKKRLTDLPTVVTQKNGRKRARCQAPLSRLDALT